MSLIAYANPLFHRVAKEHQASGRLVPAVARFRSPDEHRYRQLAGVHEAEVHTPADPRVASSYTALLSETLRQFESLARVIEIEPWRSNLRPQPYRTSADLFDDLRAWHLFIYTEADLPADHPLATPAPVEIGGFRLTWNHVFRAVHDGIGHGLFTCGFGPTGEWRAWQTHAQLYPAEALPALANETVMQSAAFYFGRHAGIDRPDRPYPDQKCCMPPDWVCHPPTLESV